MQAMFHECDQEDLEKGQEWFERATMTSYDFSEIDKHEPFVECITKSAQYGHCEAHYYMFILSIRKPDYSLALFHLHAACRYGNAKFIDELASAYHFGDYTCPRDRAISELLYKKAAEIGNDDAEFALQVARYTESWFGEDRQYRRGILNAKRLAPTNQRAKNFVTALLSSSSEALYSDDDFDEADLTILREELDWRDAEDSSV